MEFLQSKFNFCNQRISFKNFYEKLIIYIQVAGLKITVKAKNVKTQKTNLLSMQLNPRGKQMSPIKPVRLVFEQLTFS